MLVNEKCTFVIFISIYHFCRSAAIRKATVTHSFFNSHS